MKLAILGFAWATLVGHTALAQQAPLADHHQHLFSPAVAALISPPAPEKPIAPILAADVIKLLDEAGIKRAVVLSVAYLWGNPNRSVENEYDQVKATNDWTSQQVGMYPERLRGFCGLNPLKDYALQELERCAKDPNLRSGLKLHIGNAVVDFHNPQHVAQLRRVFQAANANHMTITLHLRASISQKVPYGRDEARIFLNEIVPAAPDVAIQIAHMAGAGGYSDPLVDDALGVFADAIAQKDPRTDHLYFDITAVVTPRLAEDRVKLVASRIRQLGLQRVLYGTDAATGSNLPPKESWAVFRRRTPLTEDEFQTIANNVPSYMQ